MEKFTKSKCPLLLSETTNMKGKIDEALEPSTSKSANESRSNLIELPRKAKFDKSWLERFMVGPWKEDKIVGDVQVKDEAMKIHERAIFKLLKEKRADRACQVGMPASHIADDSVLLRGEILNVTFNFNIRIVIDRNKYFFYPLPDTNVKITSYD